MSQVPCEYHTWRMAHSHGIGMSRIGKWEKCHMYLIHMTYGRDDYLISWMRYIGGTWCASSHIHIGDMTFGSFTWYVTYFSYWMRERAVTFTETWHLAHSHGMWEIHSHGTCASFTWDIWLIHMGCERSVIEWGRDMPHSSHSYDIWERWLSNLMDEIHFKDITYSSHVWGTWLIHFTYIWERRDRGIYSIWGGRSLYCLHLSISQLTGPEACFEIFVRVLLVWLSYRSLYQIFSVNPSLLYQAMGTQANDEKSF